jgi:hypothetical protein
MEEGFGTLVLNAGMIAAQGLVADRKIYGRSQELEINRFKTWTFRQGCAPMDLGGRYRGKAPASGRHQDLELAGVSC